MKKHLIKRIGVIVLAIIIIFMIGILLIPLFINTKPLEGLVSIDKVKSHNSKFVTVPFSGTDGIDIHYVQSEVNPQNDEVFIFLHGSMYNLNSWNNILDDFGNIGRSIAYDQIPYGLSEKLIDGEWEEENPYTPNAALEQLIAFLDELKLNKVYLVGSSYGGTLAIQAAIDYPDRVLGLILIDPAVFVSESMPKWLLESPQMANLGPLLARSLATGDTFYESCYFNPDFFNGERKEITKSLTKVENWDIALWEYLKAWASEPFDSQNLISNISIPTLIVYGSESKIIPEDDNIKLNNLIKDSTIKIIQQTGHLPHEESSTEFMKIVIPWTNSIIKK